MVVYIHIALYAFYHFKIYDDDDLNKFVVSSRLYIFLYCFFTFQIVFFRISFEESG